MATSLMNPVMSHLRQTVLLRDGAGLTNGQLLESFISGKDEAAFTVLVRRHGPMVLGVCRRVLRNQHDAEDAFQATFLVLVRKAGSIVPREMIANWLYGVAYRTALKARTMLARRSVREKQVKEMPEPEAVGPDEYWRDLQPLLDQELSRLPDKYRVPVILCDLECKTGKETARQLGWPEGTVSSRLARGRTMLAKRMTRHGLAVSAGSLAVALTGKASACVPASVMSSTIKAASLFAAGKAATTALISAKVAALAQGLLRAMLLTKLRIAAMVLLAVSVVGAGLGVALTHRAEAAGPATATNGAEPKSDKDRLQGTWQQVSCEGPDEAPDALVKENTLVIKDDTITVTAGKRGGYELTFSLDESKAPKTVDELLVKPEKGDKPYLGIYSVEGDSMKWCFSNPGEKRPTEFTGKAGSGWTLTIFKRDKKAKQEEKKAPDVEKDQAIRDLERMQGAWRVVSSQVADEKAAEDEVKRRKVTVKGDLLIYEYGNEQKEKREGTIKLDPKTQAFDWLITSPEKGTMLAIYDLNGDDLKIGFGNDGLVRPRQFVMGKEDVVWLLILKRDKNAKQDGNKGPDEEKPVAEADLKQDKKPAQGNPILSSDEFRGKWTGEKDGVKVDLMFSGEQARWQAHWQVEFTVSRKPENPQQPPTVGVNMGAELKSVADVKAGLLNLYLPRYTGDNKEMKQIPALNGSASVGQIERGSEGTIQLRIVPVGYKNHAPEDEYPAVEGLILRRVAQPSK